MTARPAAHAALTVLLATALGSAVLAAAGSARAQAPTPFDDVPPCHFAAEAVARTAALGLFVGFPAEESEVVPNALRQVFEGLRCADAGWALRFLRDAPIRFGLLPRVVVLGFELHATPMERTSDSALLAVALTVVLEHDGARQVVERSGTVRVERGEVDGWRVPYGDLAALDLPVFPAN